MNVNIDVTIFENSKIKYISIDPAKILPKSQTGCRHTGLYKSTIALIDQPRLQPVLYYLSSNFKTLTCMISLTALFHL